TTSEPKPGWAEGDTLLVTKYASFRKSADKSAATITAVAPGTGVNDSFHYGGQPAGVIPPGQHVVLLAEQKKNGHYNVRYDGKSGWIIAQKLHALDSSMHPVKFAMQPAVQNAFYKNQLHRGRWNKDGPSYSGNCAPTSLAMALAVFGLEKPKLSVEQSIHRARKSYGDGSDTGSTTNSQITQGATALGLKVKALPYLSQTSAKMDVIDAQLDKKHVLQLAGEPGNPGGGPTVYQKAMTQAYKAGGVSGSYTYSGHHSIFVLGRTSSGDYVIGDPISEVGMVTLTRAQLKDFVARWGGSGNALWLPQ
ncbi:MAG: hypothetical protein KC776_33320, partial [Myxococcales bacterium]|nr:hypothetical protein [Myxococcales bacterium]